MNTPRKRRAALASGPLVAALLAAGLGGCGGDGVTVIDVSDAPNKAGLLSLEEFVAASTFPGSAGPVYMVEGDIPLRTRSDVEAYYYDHYVRQTDKLAVRQFNSADDAWYNNDQTKLEYCVSTSFPSTGTWSRANVIAAMATAAQRWKDAANIEFRYISSRDSDCLSGSSIPNNRFFKVAPKAISGAVACAFYPVSKFTCSELDGSTVGVDTSKSPPISATRTIAHELGHVLGMIHEYQRADAPNTTCGIDTSRYLTTWDIASIMQASGGSCGGSPTENLSATDGVGIRNMYGTPPSWMAASSVNLI